MVSDMKGMLRAQQLPATIFHIAWQYEDPAEGGDEKETRFAQGTQ